MPPGGKIRILTLSISTTTALATAPGLMAILITDMVMATTALTGMITGIPSIVPVTTRFITEA